MKKPSILILAAGASSRLGQPKQLLKLGEKTLLTQICESALSIENQGIVVVLGANCEAIKPTINHLSVQIIFNEKWAEGMGSSISCGIIAVCQESDAVLLLLCDQPLVTAVVLEKLLEKWRSTDCSIIASQYGGSFGPPAIFTKKYFAELAALHGQQGAKKLMEEYRSELLLVDFPEGEMDIDTPEDWERMRDVKV